MSSPASSLEHVLAVARDSNIPKHENNRITDMYQLHVDDFYCKNSLPRAATTQEKEAHARKAKVMASIETLAYVNKLADWYIGRVAERPIVAGVRSEEDGA